jgi:hypothetical protein
MKNKYTLMFDNKLYLLAEKSKCVSDDGENKNSNNNDKIYFILFK